MPSSLFLPHCLERWVFPGLVREGAPLFLTPAPCRVSTSGSPRAEASSQPALDVRTGVLYELLPFCAREPLGEIRGYFCEIEVKWGNAGLGFERAGWGCPVCSCNSSEAAGLDCF